VDVFTARYGATDFGGGHAAVETGLSSQERWIEIFKRKKRGAG
jgi:hypothetical protein